MGYRFNKTIYRGKNRAHSNEAGLRDNLIYPCPVSPPRADTNIAPACPTNRAQRLPVTGVLLGPFFFASDCLQGR